MSKWKILGLQGPKGSGKDYAYQVLADISPVPIKRFAFADELKFELSETFGLDLRLLHGTQEAKDTELTRVLWTSPMVNKHAQGREGFMTYRELLQIYGTEIARLGRGQDIWIDKLKPKVYDWLEEDDENIAIITDVRYANEGEWVRTSGGTNVLIDGNRGLEDAHISEKGCLEHDISIPSKGLVSHTETNKHLYDLMWSAFGVNCR
jgi:hypothetical protein